MGMPVVYIDGSNDVEPSISSLPVPTSKPYSINREGYAYFRIPTMVITNSGTILAFAEGRLQWS